MFVHISLIFHCHLWFLLPPHLMMLRLLVACQQKGTLCKTKRNANLIFDRSIDCCCSLIGRARQSDGTQSIDNVSSTCGECAAKQLRRAAAACCGGARSACVGARPWACAADDRWAASALRSRARQTRGTYRRRRQSRRPIAVGKWPQACEQHVRNEDVRNFIFFFLKKKEKKKTFSA